MSLEVGPAGPADDYDQAESSSGRVTRYVLLALVMAVFAGGLWTAYGAMRGHAGGEVPLIRADGKPSKIRPDQPGGMAIPDLDKDVFDMSRAQPKVEKLLPLPEVPLPRPAPPALPPTEPAADNAGAVAPLAGAAPAQQPPALPAVVPPTPATPVPTAPAVEPPAAQAGGAQAAATQAEMAQPPATPKPAAQPPTAPAASAKPPAQPASGSVRLQLGALRSEAAARQQWQHLRLANKDLLGKYGASWPRADLGARGVWYRLQAGPVADAAAAERICGELKRRSVACILVRP